MMKIKRRNSNSEGALMDLSDKGLTRLEIPSGASPVILIADRNSITRLDTLEHFQTIRQLSLKSNRLVHMSGVSKLRQLTVLNLPQNSIVAIEGLRELTQLAWLNLSGNSIKAMENLSNNFQLKHLDLSDNSITSLGDIHHLNNLKTLLLHGNMVTSLRTAPHFLPKSINIFSLAENEISDINEVSFLSCLPDLQQLSVMNNPCVLMTASVPEFDPRPFIVNWCHMLEILDGYPVSEKEQLKAEWLYSQGKGHHFKVGQHLETIQYLAGVCPFTASIQLESAEDAKLSQILYKQRYHQQQLQLGQRQQNWNIPAQSPTQGDISNHSETGSPSQSHRPVRAWTVSGGDTSFGSAHVHGQGHHLNDLSVQDVTSEDYDKRSVTSMLDSESQYLPLEKSPVTPARPMTAPIGHVLSSPTIQHIFDNIPRGDNRPATAIGDTKYDSYEKRLVKPMHPDIYKGIKPPDFNVSPPQQSGTGPSVGTKKKVPPTAQAVDCDTSQDTSQVDDVPKENENVPPVRELSLIKDAAAKKALKQSAATNRPRAAESSVKSKVVEKKNDKTDSKSSHLHSGSKGTSIPVASKTTVSRTHSEYVPGKYSTARRHDYEERKGKTIKSIPEKIMSTDRLITSDAKLEHESSFLDSGIYSRPNSDAVLAEDVKYLQAATKIQSFWRGYFAREHNVDCVRVRREIRARRAEEHIVVLRTELEKQRRLYEQERQLRTLQLEAIRQLWREVQSLQSWKSEVLQSQSFVTQEMKREHEYNSYNSSLEIQNTLARAELMSHRMGDPLTAQSALLDSHRQMELEKTCANLQSQVSQLQEALKSVSSIVLHGAVGSTQGSLAGSLQATPRSTSSLNTTSNTTAQRDEDDKIMVTGEFSDIEISEYESLTGSHWVPVPHSLSPYLSEEEEAEAYFRSVPQPGFPTPPRGLKLENRGPSALVLRWQASKVLDGEGREMNKPIEGYRVFVNDKAKAKIAGSKLKALIEGLDPTLTYKIYVKAVSELGDSYCSDVVMASLSKGPRRRSTSSDSNRSYDSDQESTGSGRRPSHRKESRRSKKSPRSGKHERKESTNSSKTHSHKETERPPSKMELEAEGIMTQPRVHKHRRTPSKDFQNKAGEEILRPKETPQSPVMRSPKLQAQESQGFSFDSASKREQVRDTNQSLSSTFTVDSQNSVLFALSTGGKSVDVDNSVEPKEEPVKGHRRKKSKDMKIEKVESRGDISDSSSSVSSAIIHSRTIDGEKYVSGMESPSGRRRRSKDNSREDSDTGSVARSDSNSKRNSVNVKISPTAGSAGVPVIDGRKRHNSGSRPSSPALSEDSKSSQATVIEKRRMPMGEYLEQRFSGQRQSTGSTASSTTTLTQSQVDSSTSDLPPQIPRRDGKNFSLENLSTRSSHDYNRSPTEKFSPNSSETRQRSRNNSTCSDSDAPSFQSSAARAIDMDAQTTATGIVAKLLTKLQGFAKTQEDALITSKIKRKSGDPEEPTRKASADSDGSAEMQSGSSKLTDSPGAHTDDSQHHSRPAYRTHRRTSSDHRGVPVKSQADTPPPSSSHAPLPHSPVIRDSCKTPTPSSAPSTTNNIKRHASFHGILPSKKEDLVRSGSTENLAEKSSQSIKQQNIDITVPTTQPRRRNRSRSRSPANHSHVPIISAAQLQRSNRVPSQAT
ncbi:uncharacterized protein LOC127852875 isoform X2 [Dreissena polymorpha]|uniref:uncharacterized protein LOC127852875 isoform X2 n=1 Tax=Dreissena polymorpha TaxID=45954 RepID=UPI002264C158|nr:uncharacterized protein LOC127852875 isoform X2 [Dreissena polymorpha]